MDRKLLYRVDRHNLRMFLRSLQDGKCFYCGIHVGKRKVTLDHVRPLSRGGGEWQNVVIACKCCNAEKADRLPTDNELARLRELYRGIGDPRVSDSKLRGGLK